MSRRGMSTAERVRRLLLEADVGPRPGRTGGLLAEPVIALRGEHARGFKLFDQDGGRVGSAAAVVLPGSRLRRRTYLELRDVDGGSLLAVRDIGSPFSLLLWRWEYEVIEPAVSESLTVRRMARGAEAASITEGDARIGVIRPGRPSYLSRAVKRGEFRGGSPGFVVEADSGDQAARVRLCRPSWRTRLVHVVIEVEAGASDPLRKAALGASVKAAFIVAVAEAKRSRRRSYAGGGGYGLEAAASLAQPDVDF